MLRLRQISRRLEVTAAGAIGRRALGTVKLAKPCMRADQGREGARGGSSDPLGRWGGEEILLICPGRTVSDAVEIATRMLNKGLASEPRGRELQRARLTHRLKRVGGEGWHSDAPKESVKSYYARTTPTSTTFLGTSRRQAAAILAGQLRLPWPSSRRLSRTSPLDSVRGHQP